MARLRCAVALEVRGSTSSTRQDCFCSKNGWFRGLPLKKLRENGEPQIIETIFDETMRQPTGQACRCQPSLFARCGQKEWAGGWLEGSANMAEGLEIMEVLCTVRNKKSLEPKNQFILGGFFNSWLRQSIIFSYSEDSFTRGRPNVEKLYWDS